MQSVGQTLREERLKQAVTLEQIGAITRISLKCLSAIEADDPGSFGSAFFYKCFTRQFAEALHLDYARLDEAVRASAESLPVPLVPGQEEHTHAWKIPAIRPQRRSSFRWILPVLTLATVMAGCSGLYAVWQGTQGSVSGNSFEPGASEKDGMPAISSPTAPPATFSQTETSALAVNDDAPKPNEIRGATTSDLEPSMPGEHLLLKVSALEKSWLSIDSDGRRVYSGLLAAADTKVFEGRETARVRTGNAGGIRVVLNCKEIWRRRSRGEVMTVLFTPTDYEILQPTSARLELLPVSSISE
jgi:cytoskeletal protein RodZ